MTIRTFIKKCFFKIVRVSEFIVVLVYLPIAAVLYCAKVRFLTGNMYFRIGHLALEPDCDIKAGLLGWRSKYRGILLFPENRVVNQVLFDCWRPHYTVIGNLFLYYLLYPLSITSFLKLHVGSNAYIGKDKTGVIFPAVYTIARKYEEDYGGKPVLELPAANIDLGWRHLCDLGMPQDAWFACLHVRESGYLPHLQYHSYRDADIKSYIPAIHAVVERGGWVVRIGDSSMSPLPAMDHVIDLTQSDPIADGMDVFSLTQCNFVIGTTSGPVAVSYVFGVPTALTNWVPMGHGGYCARDTWIPKLYWSKDKERYLTFEEILSTGLGSYGQADLFERDGVSVVDNSAEEIKELCVEVMDLVEKRREFTDEDEQLQERFRRLMALRSEEWVTEARVGRNFLRAHKALFADTQ
jgi:putative glycosyltransferase (TIGR04372 family)